MKAKFLLIVLSILALNVLETFAQKNIQVAKPAEIEKEADDPMKTYVRYFIVTGKQIGRTHV